MIGFIGTYECKIDDKGRLKIPSSLKEQWKEVSSESFVIKRSVFQHCLEVYPMDSWNEIMMKINRLNRFVKKNADFIRMFTAGVKIVEVDKSDRLQISKDLVQYADLKREIVITSAGDLLEIWDKEAYEEVIKTNEADFSLLAEEVMGTLNSENVS